MPVGSVVIYFTYFYDNPNPNPNPNPNSLTRLSLIAMGAIVLETLCSPMLFQ